MTFKGFLQKKSALYLSIAERYNYYKLINGKINDIVPTQKSITDIQWQLFEKTIQEIDSLCQKNEISFVMTYVPLEVEVLLKDENTGLITNKKIAALCHSTGIPYIDIIQNFRKEKDLISLYLDDCHLSKTGNLLVAELMKKYLDENLHLNTPPMNSIH
jgi:hypothetical protein